MKKSIFLLLLSIFPNVSISKEIDCGIAPEVATSITLEEFYFGFNAGIIHLPNGLNISIWEIDKENPIKNNGKITNYLISIGEGDIAEKPVIFRIKSSEMLNFDIQNTESVLLDNEKLKIKFSNSTNEQCTGTILHIKDTSTL
jgi:hypothetical protein